MGRRTRKLNFLIEESVCRSLERLVPVGKRSKVANESLRKELELIQRRNAVAKLLAVSRKGKRFSSREISDRLAKDRGAH